MFIKVQGTRTTVCVKSENNGTNINSSKNKTAICYLHFITIYILYIPIVIIIILYNIIT